MFKKNSEIKDGDVLISRGSDSIIVATSDAEDSSAMPGLTRVECALGVLYLDPDGESEIEDD